MDFAVPPDQRVKLKESEKKDKYLDLARELKKTMEHEIDGNTNRSWALGTIKIGLVKGLEDLEITEPAFTQRQSASTGVKNSQRSKIIIIIIWSPQHL